MKGEINRKKIFFYYHLMRLSLIFGEIGIFQKFISFLENHISEKYPKSYWVYSKVADYMDLETYLWLLPIPAEVVLLLSILNGIKRLGILFLFISFIYRLYRLKKPS